VKNLRHYSISHVGLKIGIHHFQYDIDSRFFKEFEGALIDECNVKVKLELEKKETLFILNFFIDGIVKVICDRCSEPFDKNIFADYQCLVKYREERDPAIEDTDEIIFISREDPFIDVSQLIYDYINLSLPMQKIHPDLADGTSGCNPEIIKYLNVRVEEEIKADPRWEALKKFKSDN
jgi:uncharacterized metal-binding protein YceD (DUF177 family)